MPLTLAQSQAVTSLAKFLSDLLPGEPHPYADQTISFAAIARELRLEWQGGSKTPALTRLLESSLEQRSGVFSDLITRVVQRSLSYQKNVRVTRELIDELNGRVARCGFKIPELYDIEFLNSLPSSTPPPPKPVVRDMGAIGKLANGLVELTRLAAQPRGYAFEVFLNEMFTLYDLAPRAPFRLSGEQIDGSFDLDRDTYLCEARWRSAPADLADLLVFNGKVEGKASWSRGLFVSMSGFSEEGLGAFAKGRQTRIICLDGLDLHELLTRPCDLAKVLRQKARRAAETNEAFVRVRELSC